MPSSDRWLRLAALAALLLLAGGTWLSYRSVAGLVRAGEDRGHALEVLGGLEELRGLLTDAERGRRGYALGKKKDSLAPCQKAVDEAAALLGRVAEAVEDDPAQHRRAAALRPLLDKHLDRFRRALAAKLPTTPREETRLTPLADADLNEFDKLLDEMVRHERGQLEDRTGRAEQSARDTITLTLAVNGLSFALAAAVLALLFRQIGARARAETSLRQARDELAARVEERTAELREKASVLDVVREAILVCDLDGRIRYWGPGAEVLYGWSVAEAVGQFAPALLFKGDPAALAQARAEVERHGEWRGELHDVNRAGQPVIVESHWGLVRDEAGRPRGIVASNIDITEKKRQEGRALLQQRLESIGTLAGGIAHDLNNVLTPILMTVKLLRKDRPGTDRERLLHTAELSVERGVQMVKQLLSFAGRPQGQRGPVNVGEVVREVAALLEHALPKSIRIAASAEPGLPPVDGDATQLSQVLMNLAINARDAMPRGGALAIEACHRDLADVAMFASPEARPGRYVVLTVTDSGTGIAPEVMGRIFDPFFTTKDVGKGTGLGLSTALGIVRGHGGFLQLYSELGQGTRVSVYLPAASGAAAPAGGEARGEVPAGRGQLVLVVDDEDLIRATARATLEAHGYRAACAADGAEALALVERLGPEVSAVVLDMMMPGMDGLAVLREMKRRRPGLSVIAASGLGLAERVRAAEAGGACVFLHKPFSDVQLLRAVAEAVAGA